VSSAAPAAGRSPGRMIAIVILVILAILAIVAGVLYFTEPARSLPSILGAISHPAVRAGKHRPARGVAAIVVAVILLAAAWLVRWQGRPSRG
jgi:hypothetical protein